MDQDQQEQQRHVCKHCNKSFANGKVLGGHMRCHVAKNPSKNQKKLNSIIEGGERTGYGLRVNPKKSSRVSVSSDQETTSSKEIPCRICGKEFDSMRALFGHMRHHSGKRRGEVVCCCRECGREFDSPKALACHMKSHSERGLIVREEEKLFVESSGLVKRKRSRRSRYKVSPNCSVLNLSESSNNFGGEVDREVGEIAVCLLMLSNGVRSWDEFCLASDFSDCNNSSGLEVKSPNQGKGVLENGDGDGSLKMVVMKKPRAEKSEFGVLGSEEGFLDNKKLCEFSVSLEVSDPKLGGDYEIEKESDGLGMRMIVNPVEMESDENLAKCFLSEKTGFDQDCVGQSGLINLGSVTLDYSHRKSEYKCRTCNKIFHSHQALGGHQTIHRSTKAHLTPQYDDFPGIEAKYNTEELVEFEAERVTVTSCESNKEHKCHICFKVFSSGQALGGHKRAHIVKDSEAESEQIPLVSHEVCGISGHVLDTDVELKSSSWWVRNSHKHELLVGLMPN